MTVRDMIKLLGHYPEDMPVVVNGYEQGYDDLSPSQIEVIPVVLNTGSHQWEGKHGDPDDVGKDARRKSSTVDVLVLQRTSN